MTSTPKFNPPGGWAISPVLLKQFVFGETQNLAKRLCRSYRLGRNSLQKYVNNKIHVPLHPNYTLIYTIPHNKFGREKSKILSLLDPRIVYSPPSKDGEVASGLTDPPLFANDKR